MNKSSSLLLQLYLHLLHFLIMNKSSYFTKKKKDFKIFQKKKKAYGLGALGSYFLGHFQKNHQSNFFSNSFKNSRFPNFSKKRKFKIFNSFEKFKFSKKKKKKKSSLNSSSGTESYDPLPYFSMVQHQVNCPPSAFFKAWNMSETRGIRQVCRILFNE